MKKLSTLISFVLVLICILTSCSLSGKANISKLKIKESKLDSINVHYHFGEKDAQLNEEETKKFVNLFNEIKQGIIPTGELVTPDLIITVNYENGSKTSIGFYGEDYSTIDIRPYNKDGEAEDWYFANGAAVDELRKYAYETAKAITK